VEGTAEVLAVIMAAREGITAGASTAGASMAATALAAATTAAFGTAPDGGIGTGAGTLMALDHAGD
jgi:hypothetical protein